MSQPTMPELRAHVEGLCRRYGIELVEQQGSRGRARRGRIAVPSIRGQVSYLLALHELGHLRHHGRSFMRRLDKEGAAWEWALEMSMIEPTTATWRSILRRLESYEAWATRRRGVQRPEDSFMFQRVLERVKEAAQ